MKTDLIYGVEDRPPFKDALFAALQHLLAIFVAIITPPLIIAGALKLDVEKTSFLVSMSLFASGVSTFIQCRRIGPIGARLLCIQGTSFSFIGPIIATGLVGGLPLIFGSCIAAAPIEMVVSRTFKYLRNIITPLVSGIVVLLIGLSLIKVGIVSCGGGYSAMDDGSFGSWENLSIAALVLLSVLFFNRCKNKYLRMSSIVFGLCLGYGLAFALGKVNMSALNVEMLMSFNIPQPFKYGVDFNISSFIAIGLVYLITAIEATGDVTANSMISGLPIEGDSYLKRISGGVMADGFNSFLAGVFNSFPNSIFAQNSIDRSCQSLCRLLYCRHACPPRIIPHCRSRLFPDARSGIGWCYLIDVRYRSSRRYPYRLFAGNRTQRNSGIGSQPLFRSGCRTDAGCFKTSSRSDSEYILLRNHHWRFDCNYC